MPTTSARMKPLRNSLPESSSCVRNSPPFTSCQSRTTVSENGTIKAALVLRPAISQRVMPAKMLIQNGAWRRRYVGTDFDPISATSPQVLYFTIALASFQTLASTNLS